jgi:nucleoid-associated protein YgaU
VVKPGDTLMDIANEIYGDPYAWRDLAAANADQVKDPNLILPGQTLLVPPRKP